MVYRRADGNIGWIDPAPQAELGPGKACSFRIHDGNFLMELADILSEESVIVCSGDQDQAGRAA